MIISEYVRVLKARGWMKRNMPFLYSWHAYVGYELDLYEAFRKPKTVEEAAKELSLKEDLLERWVDVGLAIHYLKRTSKEQFKTARSFMLPSSKKDPRSTGVLLKEMMELHIPTLLSYPKLMQTKSKVKQTFDHQQHGPVVAETSALLEQVAYPKIAGLIKKNNMKKIIDAGCGHGGYLRRLSDVFPDLQMTGIELNDQVAKEAGSRCTSCSNIKVECADALSYQPQEKADCVMINNLLHYLSPETRIALFRQMALWLTEEGMISVITPIQHSRHGKQFSSVFNSFFAAFENLYPVPDEEELKIIADSAGMTITDFRPVVKEGGWYFLTMERTGN